MTHRLLVVGLGMTEAEVRALPAREASLRAEMVVRMYPGLRAFNPEPAPPPPSEEQLLANAERLEASLKED